MIPLPVNIEVFRPTIYTDNLRCHPFILYIGSLHSSRFPTVEVFKAFKKLHEERYKVILRVIGTPRYKFDKSVVLKLKMFSKKADLEEYVDIKCENTSLSEKIKLYNNADAILLLFKKPLMMWLICL